MKNFPCCKDDFVTPIIKVVDYCNFSCNFCRYANNHEYKSMSLTTYRKIVDEIILYNISHGWNHINIIFHGGEPLIWGLDNFKQAIKYLQEKLLAYPQLIINKSIQTNGSLLDTRWISFLKDNDFHIGISIDGPKEINYHKGLSDNIVLDNIAQLSQNECKFGILSVITNEHYNKANEYYEFVKKYNIHSVGFCYCIYDLEKEQTVKNEVLANFLTQFFDLYYYGNYHLHVREFENIIRLSLGGKVHACTFSERNRCGNYFAIYPNGSIYFCDPYSLTENSLGNIYSDDFTTIKESFALKSILDQARISYRIACAGCPICDVCGGGCFRHTFSSGKNAFCETFRILYPHIQKTISNSKSEGLDAITECNSYEN